MTEIGLVQLSALHRNGRSLCTGLWMDVISLIQHNETTFFLPSFSYQLVTGLFRSCSRGHTKFRFEIF
jgi:hypothetical protein